MKRHRIDENECEIVRALKQCGASVIRLSSVASGLPPGTPDLLIGHTDPESGRTRNILVEIKMSDGRLRCEQIDWHQRWRGAAPVVVRSVDDALRLLEIS